MKFCSWLIGKKKKKKTFPSVKALITIPKEVKERLIFFASSRVWPDAPVLET